MFDRPLPLIDAVWQRFVDSLPPGLLAAARRLPMSLGLSGVDGWAPLGDAPSAALPYFLVGRCADRTARVVRDEAVEAHVFAVLAAALDSRLRDGRLPRDSTAPLLLDKLRQRRDLMFERLRQRGATGPDFRQAERQTAEAIAESAGALAGAGVVNWPTYQLLARSTQALAFPAAIGMATASGWPRGAIRQLEATIEGLALGLRYRDDAVDWLDDHRRHASWAVALTGHAIDVDAGLPEVTEVLSRQKTLRRILRMSSAAFAQAARSAGALGADDVARWARLESRRSRELSRGGEGERAPGRRSERPSASPMPILSVLSEEAASRRATARPAPIPRSA